MGSKIARFLAAGSVITATLAVWPAIGVLSSDPGGVDLRLLWVLVPILSAVGVFVSIPGPSWARIWGLTGASCGFSVLTAWSLDGATFHAAPLIVAGAWLSAGLWAFLALTTLPSWIHRRRQEPPTPAVSLKP